MASSTIPIPVYFAILVLVLLFAGAIVGYRWVEETAWKRALSVGIGLCVGYAGIVIGGPGG